MIVQRFEEKAGLGDCLEFVDEDGAWLSAELLVKAQNK